MVKKRIFGILKKELFFGKFVTLLGFVGENKPETEMRKMRTLDVAPLKRKKKKESGFH